ncbi:MAG: hypothetical protein IPM64_05610 [Phycisphaerales bacterium]|nr:hypothetical protein [Phycisphaerales bacterium]
MRGLILATALAAVATSASQAVVVYQTGFEAAEGFSVGMVGGQAGWTVITGTPARLQPVVATANPRTGAQHFRLAKQANLTSGSLKGGFTPIFNVPAATPISVSVDVNISGTDGAEYAVALQSSAQGLLTAFVDFSFQDDDGDLISGDILVQDGVDFVPTGFEFVPGQYKTLRIDFDPATNQLTYFYDGMQIFTHGTWSGTAIDQVVLLSDNFQLPNETGDFDNLRVETATTDPCAGFRAGDANCDGLVTNFDIDPFVLALVNNDEPARRPATAPARLAGTGAPAGATSTTTADSTTSTSIPSSRA